MGRLFDADGTGSTFIALGDIAAARFERLETWTYLTFIRVEETEGDERAFIRKGTSPEHVRFRTVKEAASVSIDIRLGGSSRIITADLVALNTWYLIAVTNDGTGGANGGQVSVVEMDGSVTDTLFTHSADAGLTGSVDIGVGNIDAFDGDIAYCAYVQKELSQREVLDYLANPRSITRFKQTDGIPFFLPLGHGSPEPDWSGSGNTGTVNGSPVVGEMPPVGPLFFDGRVFVTAAAVGLSIPVAMAGYRHRHQSIV